MRSISINDDVSLEHVKRDILLRSSKPTTKQVVETKYLVPELLYAGTNFSNLEVFILEVSILKKPEYRMKKQSFGGMKALKISLEEYGIKTPIVVNKRENGDFFVVNGWNVNKMWRALKNKTIPAVILIVSIEEEQKLHLHLNRMGQETDFAAILNHLDHLNPEDFGLKGLTPQDEEDDKEYLKKEQEKAKKRAEENEQKALVRWSFTFKRPVRNTLKEKMKTIKKEIGKSSDSEVLEYLIMNHKKA